MSTNLESTEGEIFSSDGLPPLPPPSAPVKTLSFNEKGDGVLDQGDNINLVQAFEVFSGKIFPPTMSTSSVPQNPQDGKIFETPLQRLARLRMEVLELEQDFATSNNQESESSPLGSDVLHDLASRLSALSDLQNGKSSPRSVQSELTTVVSRELRRLEQSKNSTNDNSNDTHGITYELYSTNNESSGSSLEARMAKIEQMVGGGGMNENANKSVLERLEQVEQLAKSVDVTSLDAAAARAKLIRTDLEAVAKHRSKIPLPPEDSKAITHLHEQMQSLSSLSKELPLVVTRLTDLASLHSQASDFASRLTGVEDNITNAERLLVNFETVMDRVEAGCVENVKIVDDNMKHLDQRMEELRK